MNHEMKFETYNYDDMYKAPRLIINLRLWIKFESIHHHVIKRYKSDEIISQAQAQTIYDNARNVFAVCDQITLN